MCTISKALSSLIVWLSKRYDNQKDQNSLKTEFWCKIS